MLFFHLIYGHKNVKIKQDFLFIFKQACFFSVCPKLYKKTYYKANNRGTEKTVYRFNLNKLINKDRSTFIVSVKYDALLNIRMHYIYQTDTLLGNSE